MEVEVQTVPKTDISSRSKASSNKGHILHIVNYKPGEKISYKIVLIKGFVTNNACIKPQQNIIVQQETYAVSPKNTFKVLVSLEPGSNVITFNYCCQEQTFELFYEPLNKRRCVTPLYVIFRDHDGSFQAPEAPEGKQCDKAIALKKLNLNCQLIQTILAEKLFETHKKHLTFHLTEPKLFYSKLNIKESRETESRELFHKLAYEIETFFGSSSKPNVKHIAFLSGTHYHGELYEDGMLYNDVLRITKQYIALGRGGLAVFHTACLHTWPERLQDVMKAFVDETSIDRRELLDDSNYRGTIGACYSTTLGSVLHELCHTFNLAHAKDGIMSRGFDDVRDIFLADKEDAVEADRRRGGHGITDSTALHKSGAQILRYNKWFLSDGDDLPYRLAWDGGFKTIQSSWGIRVVEIRSGEEEIVTESFIYPIAKMTVQLKLNNLAEKSTIFIQDSKGNWLSQELN